jgi:tripartite-type tricarboxylate transporter receptor subunit TctC
MIIPFAPGGASDFIGRILQPKLAEELGEQVVVDNRPGASGTIGVETAANATPDGYTFLLGNVSSMGIGPNLFPKIGARAMRDLVPITLVVDVPGALGIHGGLPPGNLKEFIAYAKPERLPRRWSRRPRSCRMPRPGRSRFWRLSRRPACPRSRRHRR